MSHTPLLVVGGGPVGLSAALLASRLGIPCTLVERYPQPYNHPKARGVRDRAMELFRVWGIEEEIRSGAPADPELGFVYCESLVGPELGRTPATAPQEELDPSGTCRVPQDVASRADQPLRVRQPRSAPRGTYAQPNVRTVIVASRPGRQHRHRRATLIRDGQARKAERGEAEPTAALDLNGP
jgi:hypothetical protein